MSIQLKVAASRDRAETFLIAPDRLPGEVVVPTPPLNIGAMIFLIGVPAVMLFGVGGGAAILLALIAVAMLLLIGLRRTRAQRLNFHPDRVEVREPGWLWAKQWTAPYAEFESVRLRSRAARVGHHGYAQYQIIELAHPDERKTLPLYFAKSETAPEALLDSYGAFFHRPVLKAGRLL